MAGICAVLRRRQRRKPSNLMPVLMAHDTRIALGVDGALCESRTLLLDRWLPMEQTAQARRLFLERVLARPALLSKLQAWQALLGTGLALPPENLLFGQLRTHLAVSASAGLFENTGLCLDRFSGLPFIPGSAVKGCARRFGVSELSKTPGVEEKAGRLASLALVFGWTVADWGADSDWGQACGADADQVMSAVGQRLQAQLAPTQAMFEQERNGAGYKCAGRVRFLPAYPWSLSGPDLGVVQGGARSASRSPRRFQGGKESAESEDFFPAVRAGQVFVFALDGSDTLLPVARRWLQEGLAALGIGAQASAGCGRFDTGDALQQAWREKARQQGLERLQKREQVQREERQQRAMAQAAGAEALKGFKQDLTDEELADRKLAPLTEEQFQSKVQKIRSWDEADQQAVVRALRQSHLIFWEEVKRRAARKGGQWAQIEQAIRAVSKESGLGKMP